MRQFGGRWIEERSIRRNPDTTLIDVLNTLEVHGETMCIIKYDEAFRENVLYIKTVDGNIRLRLPSYAPEYFYVAWIGGTALCKEINVHKDGVSWRLELLDLDVVHIGRYENI